MMRKKKFGLKKCPRCGIKNDYSMHRCSECGLIFSRVSNGSNKLAKQLLLAGKKNEVVFAPAFPKDVSKKKFLLLSGFLGFFGAHNFYVGRYVKAVYQLVFGLISVVLTAIGGSIPFLDRLMSFVSVFIGVSALMWMFDFVDGCFNRYKIPVAVDILSDLN